METLSTLFQEHTNSSSNHGITFISQQEEFLSYKELVSNSLRLLSHFQNIGLKKGSKLIFQLNDNKNFVHTIWTSILGGMIATPIYTGTNDEQYLKVFNVYKVLDDAFLIVDNDIIDKLEFFAKSNNLEKIFKKIKSKIIDIRDVNINLLPKATAINSQADDLVVIQFSSGSTGEPKGVMLSNENIIENKVNIIQSAQITKNDSYLSWLPLTHDMGLIGAHINPLLLGVNQVLMTTKIFIRRPLLWLDYATKFKSTMICSPNFGYRYLLNALEEKQDWDLRHIQLIANGAEPISVELCQKFMKTLVPYGLKEESMFPLYGLAEATLAVTASNPNSTLKKHELDIKHLTVGEKVKALTKEKGGVSYADLGHPINNIEIRITNKKQVLKEDIIGHIEVKGSSVSQGYYNNTKATSSAFKKNGWLYTGDLGFIRDGCLIVTGRVKDIIIKNGLNFYPHDIEEVCCLVQGCELNKVVAVGNRSQNQEDEELIIFVLFKKPLEDFLLIETKIIEIIFNKIGLKVTHVIPVRRIDKTTSGKLQRFKLLNKYQEGEFSEIIGKLRYC